MQESNASSIDPEDLARTKGKEGNMNAPKELLQGKVTKESLEDIAAKEAKLLDARLTKLLLVPVGVALLAFVLPTSWWWGLVPLMVAFAAYFRTQQNKLETLQGRAAGRRSRRPVGVGHAYL